MGTSRNISRESVSADRSGDRARPLPAEAQTAAALPADLGGLEGVIHSPLRDDDSSKQSLAIAELDSSIVPSVRPPAEPRETMLRVGSLELDLINRTAKRGDRPIDLTPSGRIAVLELLASQAAISIESIGTHVDVTEQYAARGALQKAFDEIKKSEDRLRLVIDTIPALVWRSRPDGAAEFFNQPCLDYTGLSFDQALEWGWTSVVHPDDVESLLETWRAIWMSGMRGEAEARLRHFDGEYRWFLFRNQPLRDELGNIVKWYGSGTDIEDRKQTENALRQSEAYLAQAQRLSLTGTFGWRIATGESTWSAETFRIFGYDEASSVTVGMVFERTHPEDRASVQQTINRASIDANDFDHAYRLMMPDGSVKYVHAVARAARDASGGIEFVGAVTDVTAAKRAEEKLHKAQGELARAARLATMGELTTLIAHEVNQPLMAIVTNADTCLSWLTKANPNLDRARQAAERVVRNGHRAGSIVKSIRALARKSEPEMAQFDINDAIGEILVLLRSELRRQSVSLETELSDDLEPVTGDRVQLQQVVLNLVMNGIEAMSAVMHRSRILRVISQLQESGDVLIAVMDVGSGLDPTNIDRIFDAFFTTKPEGMGMGLAICRSIIEAHGGLLWASPQQPHGSVFQFTLPAGINRRGADNATWRG